MEKHLIIGANGPIGNEIYQFLKSQGKRAVRFGRSNLVVDDYVIGNALNQIDVRSAAQDATHIYVTIGLQYNHRIWQTDWPVIIDNVIDAARKEKSKIVFFDNAYIYGPKLNVPITEDHEINPMSKKGKVRKQIYDKLVNAMKDVDILIVRAPDFFGPSAKSSMIYSAFLENMIKNKTPLFLGNMNKKHSYGYTKDLSRATVMLASDNTSYNQVWHLPCYHTESVQTVLEAYNKVLNKQVHLKMIGRKTHLFLGIFMPMLKEIYEMRYQFEHDYVFNYEKFSKRYPEFKQTSFEEAINHTVVDFVSKQL